MKQSGFSFLVLQRTSPPKRRVYFLFFRCCHRILPLFFIAGGIVPAWSRDLYPEITQKDPFVDPLFRQLQEDISSYHRSTKADQVPPPLILYQYRPLSGETLFTLASAFNLPYETLSTLNRLSHPEELSERRLIYLPNIPGIFASLDPQSELERKIRTKRRDRTGWTLSKKFSSSEDLRIFYAGDRFTEQERSLFLELPFIFPLRRVVVTSPYGYRHHPVTGKWSFHPGVDMEASVGTPTLASREGIVAEVGTLPVWGLYVILKHADGYKTVYSHLSSSIVELGQRVATGEMIAKTGNTGLSTGPHLHFEIREEGGRPVGPFSLLPRRSQ